MTGDGWEWDETLYAGSAPHYVVGRMPYPPGLAEVIGEALGLDGTGRLLDVGCGPGSLTLLLAPLFEAAVGVDADPGMLLEASRRARDLGITTVEWVRARAEDLSDDLGSFRVATFAQSFHWMDRSVVARRVRGLLTPDGTWIHVGATTHRGAEGADPLPHPRPPWDRIDALVARYLGPVRRAGRSTLPGGTRGSEEEILRQAGFTGPTRIEVGTAPVVDRSVDEIMAAVFSLSGSTPHLFAAELPAFEADLRRLLIRTSDDGWFSETPHGISVLLWRP
ncbi:class I SAM-dependent methyltransferase [Cryptosporangium minutisporangium]|uniref:Class I SAM-dependent methyltransferase n=1 Tax=Cryptosporangium minutisporangium TaxID=113569 RepID=A0ABP6SPS8_9ACTN